MRKVLSVKTNGCGMERLTIPKLRGLVIAAQRDDMEVGVKAIQSVVRCVSWRMLLMVEEAMER